VGFGRFHREEELASSAGRATVLYSRVSRRRITRKSWCGVFFLTTLFAGACQASKPQQPTRPDTLTIGFPEGIVPGTELGLSSLADTLSLEGLSQLDVKGRAVPKLAQGWTWENDGLQLRVNLRDDVTFHDGTRLNSTLTATALRQAIARPSNRALYPSLRDVKDARPEGDLQVVLDLSRRSAFLPENLELPLEIGSPTVGTGAYRVTKREASEIVLERFQPYYLGAPRIEHIVIRPFGTLRTAWTSLLRGEVDMVMNVPPDAVEFIQNDDVQVISFARRYQYLVGFNSLRPPFTSSRVRRALNAAVDRRALIARVLKGHGISSTGPLWPQYWAYDASITPFGFDPALAASLLDAEGLRTDSPGGQRTRFRFTCLIPANFTLIERVALELQKQLYDIGVDMQFEVIPIEDFDARIREGRFEAMLIDVVSGPTLERGYQFWRSQRDFRGLNVFGYENTEAEGLYDVLRSSTNEAAVRSATSRLQRVMLDDPPALFLAWNERARAIRRNFRIVQDPARDPADPVYTIWKWTANEEPRLSLNK
jgi:peptide/nickel transport system substrate-binding protein